MLIRRINSESASEKNAMGHWDNVMNSRLQIHTALPEGHCPSCNTEAMNDANGAKSRDSGKLENATPQTHFKSLP